MKKWMMLVAMMIGSAQMVTASTEQERYWDYNLACLDEVQAGGSFEGSIYESNLWAEKNGQNYEPSWKSNFAEWFIDGQGKAMVNCEAGWCRAQTVWKNAQKEELFRSVHSDPTLLKGGLQSLPFAMRVNSDRRIRLDIKGVLVSDQDEIWFNGSQAWYDGNSWVSYVNEPWNVIGTEIEVVWVGHGAWYIQFSHDSFRTSIPLNIADMDEAVQAPTRLKAFSFLEDASYLNEDLIQYSGQWYDQNLGCQVLGFTSSFVGDIKEFTVVLRGYDEYLDGYMNYFTASLDNVSEKFIVPLGNEWIMPRTTVKVYITDPRNGDVVWKQLEAEDLWWNPSVVTTPVVDSQ
jgi:hypothetical protein